MSREAVDIWGVGILELWAFVTRVRTVETFEYKDQEFDFKSNFKNAKQNRSICMEFVHCGPFPCCHFEYSKVGTVILWLVRSVKWPFFLRGVNGTRVVREPTWLAWPGLPACQLEGRCPRDAGAPNNDRRFFHIFSLRRNGHRVEWAWPVPDF